MHHTIDVELEPFHVAVKRLLDRLVADREPEWLGISRPAMRSTAPHLRIASSRPRLREQVKPAGALFGIAARR